MKAIIPIAGTGTRLHPHTTIRQKALLPVGGKPILDHIIASLTATGITEIALVVGHLGDQVRTHIDQHYSELRISFIEQAEQQGLGHAVLLALDELDEPVIVILGDTLIEVGLDAIVHQEGNVLGVVAVDDPQRFGIVETAGEIVVSMVEKPDVPVSNLAIAGIYRIDSQRTLKRALEQLVARRSNPKEEYQIIDAFNIMLKDGEVFRTHPVDGWLDCGTIATLLSTNRQLLANRGSFIHPAAMVERSTVRSSSIMENCRVVDSTLDSCIVLPGAILDHCELRDEIVAEGAVLTGGVS